MLYDNPLSSFLWSTNVQTSFLTMHLRYHPSLSITFFEAFFQSVIGIQLGICLNEDTQGWHLCHQNNLMNMDIVIIGMLKHNNDSSHMA